VRGPFSDLLDILEGHLVADSRCMASLLGAVAAFNVRFHLSVLSRTLLIIQAPGDNRRPYGHFAWLELSDLSVGHTICPCLELPYQTCHWSIATFWCNGIHIEACGFSVLGLFPFLRTTLSGHVRQRAMSSPGS
jgi:hypothetical protein